MKLAVVVPTWAGSRDWLPECLEGLAAQTVPAQAIVVVDGPAPGVEDLVRRTLSGARIIKRRESGGFAIAASAGLRAADADLVALLNDDAVPEPGWLEALRDGAARHPNVGSFASCVLRLDGRVESAGHGLTRWGEAFAIGAGGAAEDHADERRVFGAPATASAYRRELIRDCGVFDPSLEAYLEDVEHSLRAQILGFPCLYLPRARVRHRGSASYGSRRHRLLARNRWRVLARSMPRNLLRAGAGAAAISALAQVARAPASAPGIAEGLRSMRAAATERGTTLGARRASDAELSAILRASEADLRDLCSQGSAARRLRGRLTALLGAAVDRREAAISRRRW